MNQRLLPSASFGKAKGLHTCLNKIKKEVDGPDGSDCLDGSHLSGLGLVEGHSDFESSQSFES